MLFRSFNAFVESVMAMIGLAIGIDYALLFVRRFREERSKGASPEDAIARTLLTAGAQSCSPGRSCRPRSFPW
jgi:RND superfamily putative drug exporter